MSMKNQRYKSYVCMGLVSGLACVAGGAIEDLAFGNARGVGMGGADSAAVNDSSAILVNPAALGFMARSNKNSEVDNFGLADNAFSWNMLDLGAKASLTGDLGDYLQTLGNIDFSSFDTGNLGTGKSVESLLSLAGVFASVSDNDTIVVNANAGTMFQIGHFGVGVRSFGQVGGWINNLDLARLGLQLAAAEIVTELEAAIADEGFPPPGGFDSVLNPDQKQRLENALGGASASDVVDYLGAKVNELVERGTLDGNRVNEAVDTLTEIIENSGTGSLLSDNETSVTGRAFLGVEIPVSYGYAFNDNFSVGLTAKAIFGRVFGTQVWAFNDDNEQILEDSLDSSNASVAIGLDASMMYRIKRWQFVMTGNNLNSPSFDGYTQSVSINGTQKSITVPDVKLDPQITLGAAWLPMRRLVLATDYELLETGTLLNGYNVQRWSLGSEWDLSVLQLRLGTYKNLAEDDLGWVLTGGLGLQLWAVSLDAALAMSIDDTVTYDGVDYPRTVQANLGFSMDF